MRLLCFCDCGRTKINKIDHLKGGDVKSCGCLEKGEDSYPYFKENPKYADSDCFFYIAELEHGDATASKKVIHKNAAARTKSRLVKAVQSI